MSQSLAAILEVAYRHSECIRTTRAGFAKAVAMTRGEQQSTEGGHEILRELTKLAQVQDPLIGSASELADRLHSVIDGSIGEYDVSGVLRRYDFKTKSTRLRGEEQPR